MLECLFILYILFVFILPVPGLVLTLGAYTSFLIYKKYILFRNQPQEGKRVAWLGLTCSLINFILSMLLGLLLSIGVYYFITDIFFIFAFNFLFCSLISLRWFDYTHRMFRTLIFKLQGLPDSTAIQPDSTFIMLLGLRKSTGWGRGLVPMFIDAGLLKFKDDRYRFEGAFISMNLTSGVLEHAEAESHERIRFNVNRPVIPYQAESFLMIVRDQFYPFKSRHTRDGILTRLGVAPPSRKRSVTPETLPSPGAPAS